MNQLKVQAPYLSKNPMIDHTLTSQSQPSLLSSSDYSKPVDIKQLARSGINPKDTEQLAFNIINQLQPESPTDNFESLLSSKSIGKSFLMIAAERGLHKVFSKLLRLNAFVNLRDSQGKTALFYIIESKSPDLQILQELLQKDVDLNIRSRSGLTPIQTAIERGLVNIVDLLIKKRANPFIKFEPSGDTALHVAARRRDKAMFKYLLDFGFDPKRRNKNRLSVKDVCKDQPELLDLLKDKFLSEQDGMSDQRKGPQGAERPMQNDNKRGEVGKSNNKYPQSFNRVRDENPDSLNNTGSGTQEQKNLPLRNDDNYSNASTSYSNGHSEINFHTKYHNPPLTLTSHYSDDPSKYSDKPSGQFSNNLQVHNRQRENSGVSRTSITSAQSDMVSDNESMSAHSQSNLASNSYMQQFSPDMQEKSKNGGSVGEANVGYFNTNGPQNFNRDYSRSQSYMNTSGGENTANGFNKQQKRNNNNGKYKTQGSLKTPYSNNNGGSFNDYPSPNFNSSRDHEVSQMNQQQYFNNNRSQGQVENSNGKINLINNGNNYMPPGVENRQQMMMMNENGPGSPNLMYPGGMYQNQGYNNYGEMPGMPGMMNYRGGNQQGSPQFFFNPQHGFMNGGGPNNYMGMPDFNNMMQVQDQNQNSGYDGSQNQPNENHFTNQAQQENIGLRDKLSSTMKQSKEYQVELDSAKQENRQLKNLIEDTSVSSKSLEQILKEKEELIQELIRKNQSLEDSIKQVNPDFIYDGYHSKACATDSLFTNFVSASMEDLLFNEKLYRPFPKPETVTRMLDQEVREFERAVDQYSESKQPIYDRLQELIHVTLADLMPEAECTIYGSFATGLWLPWSDIDIVIKIPQIENALNVLHLLETRLKEEDWISETKAIKNTTVPLLKVVCSEEFMKQKLDITIKDFRHNELSCVNMIKEYIALYPPLRPITLILKDLLNSVNLNNTYLGGLSSYGILLMVVYLLQTKEMEKSKNPKEEQNLGEMLLSFLHCFGLEYDYYTQYVVNPMKILTNGETPNEMMNIKLRNMIAQCQPSVQQPRIVIQDPVSTQNNVGKSTFRIIEIKSALTAAYFEAFKPCTCEIHTYVEELGGESGEKKEHQCSSILRKMYLASQSGQIFQK